MFLFLLEVCSHHLFPAAGNKLFRVLVFTHSVFSVGQCFGSHFSGMLFMYSSIMSQEISSSWSVHANPLSLFQERGQCFAGAPFCVSQPGPFSLSGCHGPSVHTANTAALKCENLKTKKGLQPPFETCCKTSNPLKIQKKKEKKKMQQLNNRRRQYKSFWSLMLRDVLGLHDITFLL